MRTLVALLVLLATAGARAAPPAARHLVALAGRDESGLAALLARQRNPASADYRRWLTPREFGQRFGARGRDLRRVERWLRAAGCRVRRFAGRQLVACDGPTALDVPPTLDDVVTAALHTADAPPIEFRLRAEQLRPEVVSGGQYVFTPSEFQRVYGLGSALGAFPADGTGRTIGIVGVSRIDVADVGAFRTRFALPAIDLVQTPGLRLPGQPAEIEALLDIAWSGAVAPGAHIRLAVGLVVADSLALLVNDASVDVITLSVALCPGGGAHPFIARSLHLFRQAAAQGQTVLVASGDNGPRSCGNGQLDPFASSPWVTAVGGTTPSPALDPGGIATGYGSEVAWDEQTGASGGGKTHVRRPRYQRGRASRTVPDVAFPAAGVYPIGYQGRVQCCVGGTSAASPTWAGAIAQLDQVLGRRVGFLNDSLYTLGRAQQHGGAAVFHDVTSGSNAFGGARGFAAGPGYDLVTGWGTINGSTFFDAFR